ncbi:MAG: hypothetical protein Q8K99_07885 [Actinomycetota bacterium]|nr:hypothetical protein [Actinomycetota bacterium]
MVRESFSGGRAMLWAATWGAGVAIGVALGGWLTVVGGVGTPGPSSLSLTEDVFVLPGLAGGVVFLFHLAGQILVAAIRSRRSARGSDQGHEDR